MRRTETKWWLLLAVTLAMAGLVAGLWTGPMVPLAEAQQVQAPDVFVWRVYTVNFPTTSTLLFGDPNTIPSACPADVLEISIVPRDGTTGHGYVSFIGHASATDGNSGQIPVAGLVFPVSVSGAKYMRVIADSNFLATVWVLPPRAGHAN